jgi:thiamine-monophosphate kinase
LISNPTDPDIKDLGEAAWIKRLRKIIPPSSPGVMVGVGDDAALTRLKSPVISTTDLLIEDVHFIRRLHPPLLLGRKALSVNLSDVAAMAGRPRFALLSMGIPPGLKQKYAEQFLKGFMEVAKSYGVELVGGDTTGAENLTISVTVLAETSRQGLTLRSRARVRDAVYVTGNLGDAALGLDILRREKKLPDKISSHPYKSLLRRLLDPMPRVELAIDLAEVAHAMIDLSDGLIKDLGHILEESKARTGPLCAQIEVERIPLSRGFKKYMKTSSSSPIQNKALGFALQGGEDYELLFTVPGTPELERKLSRLAKKHKLPITRIGFLKKASKVSIRLLDPAGQTIRLPEPVFEHFADRQSGRKPRKTRPRRR